MCSLVNFLLQCVLPQQHIALFSLSALLCSKYFLSVIFCAHGHQDQDE